jgi:hypothetical protein
MPVHSVEDARGAIGLARGANSYLGLQIDFFCHN